MTDINLLMALDAFAKYGTLSAAAERLHTSQPALTRSMKRLEDELGVSLFVRSKNHIELNDIGRHAAEFAASALAANRDFETKVKAYERSLNTISIGFCAPVPQTVFTPILNTVFAGMTISADMTDDIHFLDRLDDGTYQLVIVHEEPDGDRYHYKKCGHEDLFVSLDPSNPLTFYPEIHLKDLDGLSILLLQGIGFWSRMHRDKTPNSNYLIQIEFDSLQELAKGSDYPSFASSYYINRGEIHKGKVTVPIADPECHTDYFLVCLRTNSDRFRSLFDHVNENTIY